MDRANRLKGTAALNAARTRLLEGRLRAVASPAESVKIFMMQKGRLAGQVVIGVLVALGVGGCGTGQWVIQARSPQIEITVSEGCPASLPVDTDVRNLGDTSTAMVPPDPATGLVCRYRGSPQMHRYLGLRLGRTGAGRLAVAIDDAPTTPPPAGVSVVCPAAGFQATVLAFAYRDRPDAAVWYTDSGCQFVDNGHLAGAPGEELFTILRALTACYPPPPGVIGPSTIKQCGTNGGGYLSPYP